MFEAVLFDLDGTLADTATDLTAALNFVLAKYNKPPLDYNTVRSYAAFGSAQLIELGFGTDAIDSLKTELLDFYAKNVAVKTRLFDGVSEVLLTLQQQNTPFGVVTNKPQRFTEPLLKALKVKADCVISGDTCANYKPHPEPILKACNILSSTPKNTLFVGDSKIDLKAANSAKTPIIIANYGYLTETDAEINQWNILGSIKQPLDLLEWI